MMDLVGILSDPVKKAVLGLVLIFLGLVVVPSYTGVGPLSVTSQYYVLSASFDRASRALFGEVLLFSTPDSGSTETLQFVLNQSDAEAEKVHARPFYLSARVLQQEVLHPYKRVGYVDDYQCVPFGSTVSAGTVFTHDDVGRALEKALSDVSDEISALSDRVVVVESVDYSPGFLIFGGSVSVSGHVCGRVPDAVGYMEHQPGDQVYAKISVSLRNADGRVAGPVELTSTLGSGAEFTLYSDGREIGSVLFTGVERGTSFQELFSVAPPALLVPYKTSEGSYSVAVADHSLSFYDSKSEVLRQALESARMVPRDNSSFSLHDLQVYNGLQARVSSYGRLLITDSDVFSYLRPSVDVEGLLSDVEAYHEILLSDLGDYLSGFLVEKNDVPPDVLVLKRDVSDVSAYAYRIRYVVRADFVGVSPAIPRPEISGVDVRACTDTGCSIVVSLKNTSNDGGTVTVGAYGDLFTRTERSVYLGPLGSVSVSLFLQPAGKISSPSVTDLNVYVRAVHWLGVFEDSDVVDVNVTPSKTCVFTDPICTYDSNAGLWGVVRCKTPYDEKPSVTYCEKGDVCVGGQCVEDFITDVNCVGSDRYVVRYQYSGEKVFTCEEGYVCSREKAGLGEVPPCVKSGGVPFRGSGLFEVRPVRVVYEGPDYRALARALILIGIGVILL